MPKSNLSRRGGVKKRNAIYLDYASGALSAEANPGGIHKISMKEKNKLENARATIAQILGAHSYEIIFTSGATEANNLAILGLLNNFKKPHIITTNIEHASVLEVCRHLEEIKQAEVTYVEVEENGIVDPKKIRKALKRNTILVSVMYANNEIGTIQSISEIAKEIRHFNKINSLKVFFHTDATQAINYLPIKVEKLGVDLLSFNGAKIYGPKGIGILYVKKNTPIKRIMFGGDQEFGLRPGTENVALVTSIAKALQEVEKIKNKEVLRLTKLQDYFFEELRTLDVWDSDVQRPQINGDLKNRLPNNINITIPNIPSDLLVIELSARGIMASAKSACKSGDGKASHVIKAINKNIADTDGSLRFSLGRSTTKKDIDYTVKALSEILQKLKKWYD
jgi:cysteine desulfurase